ncbi:oleate hydratase [Paucibacter sp. APW11]|uniref:Oleate hydratase n=1 Tax=Roseateles aquae TaxID=3077235 RepID=A0ABU3PH35_9BURK|nr:oleate hydratase [Paucibacter sp. APW11]MDT9001884.1 oleate hydratase [Paucibacter sp. APW11]
MTQGRQAYLIGGGIGALASAAHLIRDGGWRGSDIHVLEAAAINGGAMDGSGNADEGYIVRGGRMFNFSYGCTYELLGFIPSLTDPSRTVLQEFQDFNELNKTEARARLVRGGAIVTDVDRMGFSARDRIDLLHIAGQSEASLGKKRIDECFAPAFFSSNFWLMWCTMFAFQPWHSAVEFKRYLHRFVHEFPRIHTLAGVDRSPLNQYDSVILPIETWLRGQGVQFHGSTVVEDIAFKPQRPGAAREITAERLYLIEASGPRTVVLGEGDLVFMTNGSMTAAASIGSHEQAPPLRSAKTPEWALWEKIARNRRDFGNPSAFADHVDESFWESFTVTCRSPLLLKLIEDFSGNPPGTGALMTFADSNWLMSIVVAKQPHFANQPAEVQVFWGYALFPDRPGNFVAKPMSECSGAEILQELLGHLRLRAHEAELMQHCRCVPVKLPYITAEFLLRDHSDRPAVVPTGSTNFAFVSQFCEQADDVVFTVEYSVRAAQTAVYQLLGLNKQPRPVYKASTAELAEALKTLLS